MNTPQYSLAVPQLAPRVMAHSDVSADTCSTCVHVLFAVSPRETSPVEVDFTVMGISFANHLFLLSPAALSEELINT